MSKTKVTDISQARLNPLQHGDVSRLVDLMIVLEFQVNESAAYRAIQAVYPVIDRLLGYPPQTPSPTLTLVQDIVHGGADPERLRRVLTARPQPHTR